MKRETYVKRLVTSYKNLSEEEKETFRFELNLFAQSIDEKATNRL